MGEGNRTKEELGLAYRVASGEVNVNFDSLEGSARKVLRLLFSTK